MPPTPFEIRADDAALADLQWRLRHARIPPTLPDMGWNYGPDRTYMESFVAYWRDAYDWRAQESVLNRWPQYLVPIEGTPIHFLHARSAHADALPLMLTHGWPGTTHEFHAVIDPLVAPEKYGGDPRDAFHVVCPAIAGYGWSGAVPNPGCDVKCIALRQVALMEALGYARYGVQGGDWGAVISSYMALEAPTRVVGVHLNMCPAPSTSDPAEAKAHGVVPGRSAMIEAYAREMKGYAVLQSLKPDQLAFALNDSPIGLAAWILYSHYLWGDIRGDLESRFDKDYLITTTMIYWLTQSMPSAIRLYRESYLARRFGPPEAYVQVPVGVAMFRDLARPKRHWAERVYNIVHWREYAQGGHFAAVEEPATLVADIREFFRRLR
ncbi:MAG: alpha/beta fold hydrolase [Gammaproteobacteria bacterium]